MAFTDVEMAILSQLAYSGATKEVNSKKNPSTAPRTGDTLYDLITENEEWLNSKLGDGYKDAIQDLKNKAQDSDYSIVLAADDKHGTGFAAIAIKDPNNNVTVATRGTEGFSLDYDSSKDVAADIELAYSLSTSQQEVMEKFMQTLEKSGYDGYYFTGHSLGGNLALYGAITFKPIEKVKGVVTFNAPGFNDAFISKYAAEITAIYNRVNNYQNEYDYVSSIMFVPGPVTIIESSKKEDGNFAIDDHLGFDDHGLNNLTVDGNGFDAKEPQVKSVQTQLVHVLVEEVLIKTGIKGYTLFVGIVEIAINFGRAAISTYKKLSNWIKDLFSGKNANSYGSFLQLNTATLRTYADRLARVNQRIVRLDQRMDTLYGQVGLRDLWNLMQADVLTGYSWRLNRCINYLNDTASDFESVERTIANQI